MQPCNKSASEKTVVEENNHPHESILQRNKTAGSSRFSNKISDASIKKASIFPPQETDTDFKLLQVLPTRAPQELNEDTCIGNLPASAVTPTLPRKIGTDNISLKQRDSIIEPSMRAFK